MIDHGSNTLAFAAATMAGAVLLGACATPSTKPAAAPAAASSPAPSSPATTTVKGPDGKEIGEYVGGKPAPNSKFAKLTFGMTPQQVMNAIGAPSDTTTHETGKRWIPFYFGPDARRTEVLYKGEGCLTYTGGNIYGSGSNELIVIQPDPKGTCFDS